ncbi:MAG: TRAP transporter small permease [Alphaproteobacteria bacterium]|nr:TRAP transporter small permease [Alphaproteobacteria bacterium]
MTAILNVFAGLLGVLENFNRAILWIGRQVSWVLIGGMVIVISIQVFCRYVLNNALPWPEEAARAMMIWMMALTAPSAYRWGGFVAITMILDALPFKLGRILNFLLTLMAAIILLYLLYHAQRHFNSGFIFKSSTLKIPLAYIYVSMTVCFGLMLSVNLEMLIRLVCQVLGGQEKFAAPQMPLDLQGE